MSTATVKLTRIGNSRGVRLPAAVIRRYGFRGNIKLEERDEGLLLLLPKKAGKLSWEGTAEEMAASGENWNQWQGSEADGLSSIPWESGKR